MRNIRNYLRNSWLGASALLLAQAGTHSASAADAAPQFATPPGVTLVEERTRSQAGASVVVRFGDERGLKAYARRDPNRPCGEECTKGWSPLIAPQGTAAFGEWTTVNLSTGAKQWAYKGEPLFVNENDPSYEDRSEEADDAHVGKTFDTIIASVRGKADPKKQTTAAAAAPAEEPAEKPAVDLDVWKLPVFESTMPTPAGISVASISNAFGEGLVDDKDMTIYVYRGKKMPSKDGDLCDGACEELWSPVRAPRRAIRVGDFTVVSTEDGMSQWAFRGMPLYTYAKDIVPGHANGGSAGEGWEVALTARYFTPPGVKVSIASLAEVLTVNGQTLYTRNPFIYQLGGHNTRGGLPVSYAVGKKQGLRGCDSECLKEWRPFAAPADAKPHGFWQIASRPDGTRQWEYKGYVLYTYVHDLRPGEINGNDIYDLVDGEAPARYSGVEAGGSTGAALFWHVATP